MANSEFMIFSTSVSVLPLAVRLVSSANSLGVALSKHFGKSFTYIRNSKGPNIEPCATP